MKAFYSLFIAIMVAAFVAGCGNKSAAVVSAPGTPGGDVMTLKQAVQTFNTQEGHFPKTLDELVPKYIPKIPDAPSGYKIIYNSDTGETRFSR
jgi:hypothetical protein